uniref:Threonine synthase like 2 n=1 Tax=Chrysemys picta bellii TaxID=8478 RepID=A0A8C3F6N3_CHRPI
MRYVSTRGEARSVDFEGALFSGYAPDGGLFMPQEIPTLDYNTLRTWSAFSYPELVKELSSLFISSELIPRKELNDLIDNAFRRFRHKNVVHLARLKNGLNCLELWHGVTYAFKDLSLSCTGQFLQYFLKKRKKHITILVGRLQLNRWMQAMYSEFTPVQRLPKLCKGPFVCPLHSAISYIYSSLLLVLMSGTGLITNM